MRAEQYYDAADGAAAATRVTLGSSGAAAALLGLVPGEVVTFAVLVAIIIGVSPRPRLRRGWCWVLASEVGRPGGMRKDSSR